MDFPLFMRDGLVTETIVQGLLCCFLLSDQERELARPLRRSTSFPNSSFNPSLESSLPIISFNEEIWFAVPSCRRFIPFIESDGGRVVCVDCIT